MQSSDHLFLVMDYCSGGEFYRMLKSQPEKRLSEEVGTLYGCLEFSGLIPLHAVRAFLLCRSFAGPGIPAFVRIYLQVRPVIWLFDIRYDSSNILLQPAVLWQPAAADVSCDHEIPLLRTC